MEAEVSGHGNEVKTLTQQNIKHQKHIQSVTAQLGPSTSCLWNVSLRCE